MWLAVYWPAAMAAVQTWWDSPTYSHCFLVIPISAYLVWRKREQLACATPTPEPLALLLVIPAGLLWLRERMADWPLDYIRQHWTPIGPMLWPGK